MLPAMPRLSVWKTPLTGIAISIALLAQQPSDKDKVEFDVVSIKPGDPAATGRMAQQTPGRFSARNLRLFELIMGAWHLKRDQIIGGPSWLETAGWDIDARFPAGTSATQVSQMIDRAVRVTVFWVARNTQISGWIEHYCDQPGIFARHGP
jgi:hypothetical protein